MDGSTAARQQDYISDRHQDELTALANAASRLRMQPVQIGGRKVWVKQFGVERLHPGRFLHWLASPFIYPRFLKSSALRGGRGMLKREKRKISLFERAGFKVPAILAEGDRVLILADLGESAKARLGRLVVEGDLERHQAVLESLSAALGRIHAAGLCHGRPLARDAILSGGDVVFVDFEEEPEAVMPLADAQARDLWVQMLEISALARGQDTMARCFDAYRREAPEAVLKALRRYLRFFRPLRPLLRGLCWISAKLTRGYAPRDLIRLEGCFAFLERELEQT